MNTDSRFDRLEQKIDKLTDAVTKIVRVEEQLISNNRRLDRVEERVTKTEDDIEKVAEIARNNATVTKFADKLFWVVMTAGIATLFYFLR